MADSRFRTIRISEASRSPEHVRFITYKSPAIRQRADLTLFVPPGVEGKKEVPRILLLHGVYASHWAWVIQGNLPGTAMAMIQSGALKPCVVAMPSDGLWGDGSGYVRHPAQDFEKYIVDDVPDAVEETVGCAGPVLIGGLSMGGFGALRLGAKYPARFKGISGHSSITHLQQMGQFVEEPLERYGTIEGPSVLHWMVKNKSSLPPVRFDCGKTDVLIEYNRKLHRDLTENGVPHTYEEFDGEHNWDYWSVHVKDTLRFFSGLF